MKPKTLKRLTALLLVFAMAAAQLVMAASFAQDTPSIYVGKMDLVGDQYRKVARKSTPVFRIRLYDISGNRIDRDNMQSVIDSKQVTLSVFSAPAGAYPLINTPTVDGDEFSFTLDRLTENGSYVIRASVDSGVRVDIRFDVKDQGTVTGLNFGYSETVLNIGDYGLASAVTGRPYIRRVDANGVESDAFAFGRDIIVTSSDNSLATVDSDGRVKIATYSRDDAGKTVTINVTDADNLIVASYMFKVAGLVDDVIVDSPVTSRVGMTASINLRTVDSKGRPATGISLFGADPDNERPYVKVETDVMEWPDTSKIKTDIPENFSDRLKTLGNAGISVYCDVPGTVRLRILLTDADGKEYLMYPTLSFDKEQVEGGPSYAGIRSGLFLKNGSRTATNDGKSVRLDMAPFVRDGVIYVPVRSVSEKLGAKVGFIRPNTVTITRGPNTALIDLGSDVIEVTRDGKADSFNTGTVPLIIGRKMVMPYDMLAEILGVNGSYMTKPGSPIVDWIRFWE